MPFTGLCIELRPNLRSGVVFLQLDQPFSQRHVISVFIRDYNVFISEKPNNRVIDLDSSDSDSEDAEELLLIRHDQYGMDICHLSAFVVSGSIFCFRINYNQIDLTSMDGSAVEVPLAPLLPSCQENEAITINCRDCRAELVAAQSYRRLREFPSFVVDPSEFFCHSHGPAGNTQPFSLVPAETDLFYGLNYVVINFSVANSRMLNREDHLYCNRCMRYLGQTMLDGAAARIWADAVRWLPAGAAATVPERHFFQSSTLTQLVKRLLHSLWPQALPQFCLTSSRAVLVTTLPNRKQQYMFLHVVESQLRVLRRIRPDSNELRCFRACKLYYGVFGTNPPFLEKWQAEQTLPQMEISPNMFLEIQQRLETNGQLIPDALRLNCADERLQLSYFFYENEEQPNGVVVTLNVSAEQMSQLNDNQQKVDDPYETDAGHASESDDEYSDTDTASEDAAAHSVGKRTLLKRSPTPPRSCVKMATSSPSTSTSSEDK
ncbi:uncharacterized protein LOC6550209 [Drosophila erecta]|uniref:Uncharacterized protein n=1 Tax=Drosophila erecta TaxID=7220 RepID=B3NUQ0_DROER|nr:uncharacterized protein LOC6550209 [Drosophila erecta]EDV46647.1 uncharacterized protein Dere_GG18087 [Drosophila erecta]